MESLARLLRSIKSLEMKKMSKGLLVCFCMIPSVMGLGTVFVGCATADKDRNSNFTHGNVQRVLKKGVTTQQQVIEVFGAPNITTTDANNNEVWTYQKHSVGGESLDAGGGVIGVVPGAVGVGGTSGSAYSQSSKTMTLIIKFNEKKIVIDFQSMYSSF